MSRTDPVKETAELQKKWPQIPAATEGVPQVAVVFIQTVQWECAGRKKGPRFYKDREYSFDEPFAHKWIKRGKAYNKAEGRPDPREDEDETPQEDRIQKGGASADLDAPSPRGNNRRDALRPGSAQAQD